FEDSYALPLALTLITPRPTFCGGENGPSKGAGHFGTNPSDKVNQRRSEVRYAAPHSRRRRCKRGRRRPHLDSSVSGLPVRQRHSPSEILVAVPQLGLPAFHRHLLAADEHGVGEGR